MGINVALSSIFVVFKTLQVDEVTVEKMQMGKRGQRVRPVCSMFTRRAGRGRGRSETLVLGGSAGRARRPVPWGEEWDVIPTSSNTRPLAALSRELMEQCE